MGNKTLLEKILDQNDSSTIILYNQLGEEIAFEQICVVPIDEDIYVILKPVQYIEGVGKDEGLVFLVDGEDSLSLCTDEDINNKVFDIYFELLNKQA